MLEELLKLDNWIGSIAGGMHFFLALFCLIVGPVLFFRRKGGTLHRALGGAYVLAMLAVNVSALTMYGMGRFNLFHLFAIISLATLIPAIVAISQAVRTGKAVWFAFHAHFMAWSYYGLLMAGLAQVFYRTIPQITGSFESVNVFWWWLMPLSNAATLFLTLRYIPRIVRRWESPGAAPHAGRQQPAAG